MIVSISRGCCSPERSMDETLVRKVSADMDVADAIVGFHAQQAAEKLIKAVLAARDVAFMKSHALSYLVGLVEEHKIDAPPELSEADVLSPWAVEFRYEGEEPPALDRPAALALVEKLRAWAERQIEAPDQPPEHQQASDQDQQKLEPGSN